MRDGVIGNRVGARNAGMCTTIVLLTGTTSF